MFRKQNGILEVLLAHPGGPFFKNKDGGHWTIPKGEPDEKENLFDAAKREFTEETGIQPNGKFFELGSIIQKGGKEVFAWAIEGSLPDDFVHTSNLIELEWPQKSGKKIKFPEIDKIEFFEIENSKRKIKESQSQLIDRLVRILAEELPGIIS